MTRPDDLDAIGRAIAEDIHRRRDGGLIPRVLWLQPPTRRQRIARRLRQLLRGRP